MRVRAVVARLGPDGIDHPITYGRNGARQAQPFWQMFQHLVNHGSYHRGQITTMVRHFRGAPPKPMGLIASTANAPASRDDGRRASRRHDVKRLRHGEVGPNDGRDRRGFRRHLAPPPLSGYRVGSSAAMPAR